MDKPETTPNAKCDCKGEWVGSNYHGQICGEHMMVICNRMPGSAAQTTPKNICPKCGNEMVYPLHAPAKGPLCVQCPPVIVHPPGRERSNDN